MSATTAFQCVVDASVVAKLFIPGAGAQAEKLFLHLTHPESRFHVPDLLYIEVTNVLWKLTRYGHYALRDAEANIANLNQLTLIPHPTQLLNADALKLAARHGISAYDACYVALAMRQSVPLISADDKLLHALAHAPCAAQALNDL
jgi:predicted nucleic acid-binding protein